MLRQADAAFAAVAFTALVIHLLVLATPLAAPGPTRRSLSPISICFVPRRAVFCFRFFRLKASINLKFAGAQILN